MIGRRVGVYELQREIGRGGMGAVYLGKRADGEFRQTVAIKLIKRGMDTDSILKRFRRERQIIASLDHPNIAYFLSGGSTDEGLPYFVMEYIDGKPLYNFCSENRLTINERLQIFRQICEAVEVAHQSKIIHRDLKPSNILVKADGTPKLLDFGIAKVLDADSMAADFDSTATAVRLDPEYALAYVGIADFHAWSAIFGAIPCRKAYPQAKHAAECALEVDDSLGEAFAILAFITLLYDWNWTEAEKNYRRAVELSPNYSLAHEWLGSLLVGTQRFEEGVEEIYLAEKLDPLSLRTKTLTAWTTYQAGKYEESLKKSVVPLV